jgi:hypothetical protein
MRGFAGRMHSGPQLADIPLQLPKSCEVAIAGLEIERIPGPGVVSGALWTGARRRAPTGRHHDTRNPAVSQLQSRAQNPLQNVHGLEEALGIHRWRRQHQPQSGWTIYRLGQSAPWRQPGAPAKQNGCSILAVCELQARRPGFDSGYPFHTGRPRDSRGPGPRQCAGAGPPRSKTGLAEVLLEAVEALSSRAFAALTAGKAAARVQPPPTNCTIS